MIQSTAWPVLLLGVLLVDSVVVIRQVLPTTRRTRPSLLVWVALCVGLACIIWYTALATGDVACLPYFDRHMGALEQIIDATPFEDMVFFPLAGILLLQVPVALWTFDVDKRGFVPSRLDVVVYCGVLVFAFVAISVGVLWPVQG